jgi:hypothetical protein
MFDGDHAVRQAAILQVCLATVANVVAGGASQVARRALCSDALLWHWLFPP